MVHVIVGYGEVGQALGKILGIHLWYDRKGPGPLPKYIGPIPKAFDVVHICIPYSAEFEKEVKRYAKRSKLVIVHSTVPLGTCDKLGVVHSPIRGVHPHLEEGIRTFTKYFGGKNAMKAARIFSKLGLRTRAYTEARTTEAMKLWETTQYGRFIKLEKEIYAWCKKNKVDFDDVYTRANMDYNEGYTKLNMPHVVRPVLKHVEGPIGGHCVLPNAKLLGVKL